MIHFICLLYYFSISHTDLMSYSLYILGLIFMRQGPSCWKIGSIAKCLVLRLCSICLAFFYTYLLDIEDTCFIIVLAV